MATKAASFNMRIEQQKKDDAEELFESLGMTLPQAINIFISQSLIRGGLPFDVRIPNYNAETLEAMKEAKDILSGKVEAKGYTDVDELFEELSH